jgi:FMN hydrolase / 5-amino-6-(5-phospho-D-ribitylamino)uracil phosphatase
MNRRSFEGLRALCFDLDDTFWDVRSVLARAEDGVQAWLAVHHPRLAARHTRESFIEARLALARAEPARAHDMTWLRTETMRRLAVAQGCPDSVGAEAFEVFIALRNEVTLFDDVRPALRALAQDHVLATFSNGNADLVRIGFAEPFVVSLNAEQVGVAKPDPAAFLAVASRLGIAPREMAYVGDDPRADVGGSRSAGMRAVWINRRGTVWPADMPPPDLEIRDLLELVDRARRG